MTALHQQDEFAIESEKLPAGLLMGIVGAIATIIVMIVGITVSVTGIRFEAARVDAIDHSGYPQLRQTRASAQQKLMHYEVIDAEKGVYRVPIERAIDLIAEDAADMPASSSELRLHR